MSGEPLASTGSFELPDSPSPRANPEAFPLHLAAGLLAIIAAAAYLPLLQGEFLWDDGIYIFGNPLMQSASGLREIWRGATVDYQPLTNTLWWLEWRLWPNRPAGFYAVNVLLHIIN